MGPEPETNKVSAEVRKCTTLQFGVVPGLRAGKPVYLVMVKNRAELALLLLYNLIL